MKIECIIVLRHFLLPPQKSDLTDLTEIWEFEQLDLDTKTQNKPQGQSIWVMLKRGGA